MAVYSTSTKLQVLQKWLRQLQSRAGALAQNNAAPRTDTKRMTLVKILRSLQGLAALGVCCPVAGGGGCVLATPAMTGNTTPSGAVSTSGGASNVTPAWNAFDQNTATTWREDTEVGPLPVFIQYNFPGARTIGQYSITTGANRGTDVAAWTLQGSNDGVSFTTLDTQSGITWTSNNQVQRFTIATPASYLIYRLTVTAAVFPAEGEIGISEIGLLTC